jgi:hypothetical protein
LATISVLSAEARVASAPFEKGLILMRDRDILLTGDKWNVAVNIALDDCANLIQGMRFILAQIQRNIELHQSPSSKVLDVHWEKVRRLSEITDELETDLASVPKLL